MAPDVVKMYANCEGVARTDGAVVPRGLTRFGARTTQLEGPPRDTPLRVYIEELVWTCLGRGAIVRANADTHGHR